MPLIQVIIATGRPGAGKGTVCDYLKRMGICVISTRMLLEEAEATGFIDEGCLAPDDLVCRLLIEKLEKVGGIVIIDTLRSIQQCQVVLDFLSGMTVPVATLHLRVDEEIALQRMQERGRNDDASAEKRMADYNNYGPAVLEWLSTPTHVIDVNANQSTDDVLREARRQVDIIISTRQFVIVPEFMKWDFAGRKQKLFA